MAEQARSYGVKVDYGRPAEAASGTCAIGVYGTAVFRLSPDRAQLWFVSNSRDIILVSYICPPDQRPGALAEAQAIIDTMTLVAVQQRFCSLTGRTAKG